jgi:hypothetical protein
LILHGFSYQSLTLSAPTDAKRRCDWLSRQSRDQSPPYEQLVRVLRQMGHDRDARSIAIAKQAALRRSGQLPALGRLWNLILAVTVRYGDHPGLIILWIAPLMLFGAFVFLRPRSRV